MQCICMFVFQIPFNSETELMGGFLYLVLGFTVQHVGSWDSFDGQDDITRTKVGVGRLTARSDLEASK